MACKRIFAAGACHGAIYKKLSKNGKRAPFLTSFGIPKNLYLGQIEFSLVLYLKLRQFQQREQDGRSRKCAKCLCGILRISTVTGTLRSVARFWGVGCLRLFVVGSRRPQVDKCIQLHAFFISKKDWTSAERGELVEFCSCPLSGTSTISTTRIRQ